MQKITLFLTFTIFLCFTAAYGKIITVDAGGGGDFETIHAATAASTTQSGDTILVMSGTYYCNAASGVITVNKKLFIIGSGYTTVANGGTMIIDSKGDGIFDLGGTSDGTHISGFRMECKGKAIILNSGADKVVIEKNFFNQTSNAYIIHANSCQTDTIRGNIFNGASSLRAGYYQAHGIYLVTTTNIVVCNNLFAGVSYAINDYSSSSTNSKFLNNIFLHIGSYYDGYGVYLYGSSVFASNILMNCSYTAVTDYSNGNATISNNCFFNVTAPGSKGYEFIEADPQFKSFSSNDVFNETSLEDKEYDFHLNTGSPCIDAGITGSAYLDWDGSRNDMGIYGGKYPFNNDLGIPTIPEVISISVTPSSVSPSGTITVKATGRIGSGPGTKALGASPTSMPNQEQKTTSTPPKATTPTKK